MSDVMESIKKYVDTAAVITSEAIESTRKYVDVAKTEKRITNLYARLGRAEYNTKKGIKDESELAEKIIKQIDYTQEELKRAKRAYAQTKSVKCPACGHKNSAASQFCSKCGETVKK